MYFAVADFVVTGLRVSQVYGLDKCCSDIITLACVQLRKISACVCALHEGCSARPGLPEAVVASRAGFRKTRGPDIDAKKVGLSL